MPPKIHIFVKSASSYFLASVFFSFHPLFMLSPSSPFPSLPFSSVDGVGEYGTLPVLQQLGVAWLLSFVRALVLSALGAVNTATSRRRFVVSPVDRQSQTASALPPPPARPTWRVHLQSFAATSGDVDLLRLLLLLLLLLLPRSAMSDADDVYTLWPKTPRPYYFSNNSVHSILNKFDTSDYALAHHT